MPRAPHAPAPPLEPLRALGHPLWIAALIVLVVNDHVLKGAGALPAVTGKLSDVAGLIVAPALLAAIARARTDAGLAAAWLATGAGFAAIQLSPAASAAYERALAFVGARNVADPTDLVALLALPLGWRALRPAMARPAVAGIGHRALAIAGALACIATPAQPPKPCPPGAARTGGHACEAAFPASLYLGNVGTTTTDVVVRTLRDDAPLGCAELHAANADAWACLVAPHLGPPAPMRLRPRTNVRLDAARDGCAIAVVAPSPWFAPALVIQRWSGAAGPPDVDVPHVGVPERARREPAAAGVHVDAATGAVVGVPAETWDLQVVPYAPDACAEAP